MAYEKQNWINLPIQTTPLSAARLMHMETQYDEAAAYTDAQIALNPGPSGTITSATATQTAAGTQPTITLGGTPSARTMAFGIPAGAKGDTGDTGDTGPSGTITNATASGLAAGAAPTVTLGGTAQARTFAFGIPKGDKGDAGTITSATATPLAAGANPTVTLGGTASARTFAFGIPAGAKGDQGEPGADGTSVTILGTKANVGELPAVGRSGDAWMIDGDLYVWTGDAWENVGAIQGPAGNDGAAGTITSATASALAAGSNPTVTLGGTPSARTMAFGIPSGANGAPGTSATITGATAVSLPAGSAPTVTSGGTASARTFEFGIPKGDKGDQGNPGADGALNAIPKLTPQPTSDRIVFWDQSAAAYAPLTASTGLAITGTSIAATSATETVQGISERATVAEAVAGVDATRHVTPAGVAAAIAGKADKTYVDAAMQVGKATIDALPTSNLISAHRSGGDTSKPMFAPEGSVEAIGSAIALGAHIIDIDYRTTADGTMVVCHDTTVDRTTIGSGLVSNCVSSALPVLNAKKWCGDGYENPRMPTVEEYLRANNSSIVVTIEAKEGVSAVAPLAALIKRLGMVDSVFINTNSVNVVTAIVAAGCRAHLWAHADVSIIPAGINAGAELIEVPKNASNAVITQCQTAVADPTKKLKWFISGPISTRAERDALPAGIMGHVSDALGMTNRPGNNRLVTDIRPSLAAGKRGVGWFRPAGQAPMRIEVGGIVSQTRTGFADETVYLGDISSNTLPASYTVNFSFIASASIVGTVNQVRLRMACTTPDKTGLDADTSGYVVGLRGNGELAAWVSPVGGGGGTSIGTASGTALVAGTEYTVSVNVTPTTIEVLRAGSAAKIGPVTNSAWRGGHLYLWFPGILTSGCKLTGVWYS